MYDKNKNRNQNITPLYADDNFIWTTVLFIIAVIKTMARLTQSVLILMRLSEDDKVNFVHSCLAK